MKTKDYIQLQEKYSGKFIATMNDQVVAEAKTHKELTRAITEKKLKRKDIIYEYIEPKGVICVY
ncbi:MAG: DUF5678 domain-containing protein [Nitrospirota bacterium]